MLFDPLAPLTFEGHPIRLAFKGGSSLSKAYRAIHRFSEDIDLTLHFEDLGVLNQPLAELRRKQADRAKKALDGRATDTRVVVSRVPLSRASATRCRDGQVSE